jgi:predicted Zn-dependent protease
MQGSALATAPIVHEDDEGARQAMLAELAAQREMLGTMLKGARQLELDGKRDAARAMLNEVKSKDPDYPYVMSMLGYIAWHEGKPEEAIQDYEIEIRKHREVSSNIVVQLASLYVSQKRYGDAETLLRKYLDRNDVILFTALASAQARSGDDAAALATLQAATAAHPNEGSIELALGAALHRTHHDKDAAAVLKTVMLSNRAAGMLNSGAYLLSEMNLELPMAEAGSRRAIEVLETASAQVTLDKVNDTTFAQTALLTAAWDTLGWILFREGKPEKAEPYIQAAWFNRRDVVVGDHYAQVLEALRKPSEALTINEAALECDGATNHPEESAELKRNIERLRQAETNRPMGEATQILQDMWTFRIAKPADVNGSGVFRIVIVNGGIEDNDLMKGPSEMRELGPELKQLKMPGALPPNSRAHLFHDGTLNCPPGTNTCEFSLAQRSGVAAEEANGN